MEIPINPNAVSPKIINSEITNAETAIDRNAILRLIFLLIPWVRAMNTGVIPIGSIIMKRACLSNQSLLGTKTSLEPLELISETIPASSIVSISLAALL